MHSCSFSHRIKQVLRLISKFVIPNLILYFDIHCCLFQNLAFRLIFKPKMRVKCAAFHTLYKIFYGNKLNKKSCQSAAAAAPSCWARFECTSNIKRIKYCFSCSLFFFVIRASFSSSVTFFSLSLSHMYFSFNELSPRMYPNSLEVESLWSTLYLKYN